jgi:hypothetical protein
MIWNNNLQDKLISVTVDGILIEGDITIPNNNGMGEWRKEPCSPFLVLSQLYQWGNGKHPDGHYVNEILQIIKDSPNKSIYGDIDFNLLEYDRKYARLPKIGRDLLTNIYNSTVIDSLKLKGGE